ncbi:hypothetical protein JH06_1104 [Blastocystis sp. subtype 4]|uniref:hypothetical protein n=1 Tax=Blastocystis sp. subtype 4 TaxID=944170 RepID=UPI000711A13D|nr:hypothetical protein JH06_1104 [Blastocystis sp. subtype 4]KNB45199.1 hypothetical protein JH06_1104 [Blastocystis sp. subtype 4]|eukprot:XP_014528642.1 hypothetical protein JH06_1104 [Blastocystis sp. subtype 4]
MVSLLFSIYYCENCTVKSAKKWVSAVNQAAGTSSEQYFALVADDIRKEMHESLSCPVLCLASILPFTGHEFVNTCLLKARLEYCRGNYTKVLAAKEQINPDTTLNEPFSSSLLGCSSFALGKKQMARFYFERCSSTCTEVYQQKLIEIDLGRTYESIGNYEQAAVLYRRALQVYQQNPILHFHYAECILHLINRHNQPIALGKEVYNVYLNVLSIVETDNEYIHILILTYYRMIEVSFYLYMFPQVDEYCKEILSITESKNSLLDKTGRFCSTQIKLFCVYMQARSRIIVNRYDEALSILLPKDLDNLYPPEISIAIRTNTCSQLNRIHNNLILQLLELLYFIYERLEDFDHAQTMAEILFSVDPSIESWKRYLKISVYTGEYGRACLKYCSYIKDHL